MKLQGIVDKFAKSSKKIFVKCVTYPNFVFWVASFLSNLYIHFQVIIIQSRFGCSEEKLCLNIDTPYLSVFSPNAGKYRPEETPYMDTFHAVMCRRLLPNKLLNKVLSKLFLRLFRSPQKQSPGVFYKKVFLKISQYSLENICAGASF